jgi:D-alanyl-D-alanine carboxypeptidase (penicillin-binding protein 5/6)
VEVEAESAILVDYDTDEILYQKNVNEIAAPSSMTKIMTAYVIFEMLENGEININDKFKVSVKAWKQDGTRMFLEPEWKINVDELLKGLLIVSGNDAAVVLAEGSMGTVENFVVRMNKTAKELGMNDTNFTNPNGLHEKTHYMSVYDLTILSKSLIRKYNKYYEKYFSQKSYGFNGKSQRNRNWLLSEYEGTDGIKTGFTDQGKYSIAASAEKDGKRFIVVLNGVKSDRERTEQCKTLFDYAFSQYQYIELFKAGEVVGDVNLFFGISTRVTTYTKDNIYYATKKTRIGNVKVQFVYDKYIFAPIKQDDKIAKIRVIDGNDAIEYDLYAKEGVDVATKTHKFRVLFKYYAKKFVYRFF